MKVRPSERPGWFRAEFERSKRRHQFHEPHPHARAAQDAADDWKAGLLRGEDRRLRGGLTVDAALDRLLLYHEDRYRERPTRTLATAKSRVRPLRKRLGQRRICDLVLNDFLNYKRARLQDGLKGPGINREIATLSEAYGLARELGLLGSRPPANPMDVWSERHRVREVFDPHIYTYDELDAQYAQTGAAGEHPRFRLFWMLGRWQAMRHEEAASVHSSWYDRRAGIIRVPAAATKGFHPGIVALEPAALEEIDRVGPMIGDWFPSMYWRAWHRLQRMTGMPQARFHDLRHTRITEVYAQRGLEAAQAVARHRDVKMTMRYTHLSEEFQKQIQLRGVGRHVIG